MSRAVVSFDEFEVDATRNELRRSGQPVKVDALVINLLVYLAQRDGELVTHEELIAHVWEGRAVSDNVVSVCMAKLRKALGHRRGEREFVLNVYGRGYRFMRPVHELSRRSDPPGITVKPTLDAAPFVGRDAVMLRLRAALENARAQRGSVCALLGEPGIGKTRVAEALEQHARATGVRVAWGRTRDLDGAPPFWPWVEVVRGLLAAVSIEGAEVHLGRSFAELARMLPELSAAPGRIGGDDAVRYRTFDAVARLLALAGQEGPWLLVLDDLHRGDAASLELLSYLVDEIARLPVLIIATLRSTERLSSQAQQHHVDRVLGHRNCERVELARLLQRDVTSCVQAYLGRADEDLSRAVFAKSEGNAFFMTELLRELGERQQVDPRQGDPRSTGPHRDGRAREPALPHAALDLVRQRVRRVGEDAHPILQAAAVLGRSFELSLLSTVTGVPAGALIESLDHALATDLIVASPEGIGRFAFGHDLIRAVLYDALPNSERAALHLRVAEALAQLQREGREVASAELAHHFLSALPDGDVVHAAVQVERAAEAAMGVVAYADAAAMLRRALAALDLAREPAAAVRCRLHYRLSVCLRVSDACESIAELRKSVALARENHLPHMLAIAGQAMVRSPGVVMVADGRGVLEDALAGLAEDEHALRATVLSHLSWCAPYCFDREQCAALVQRAITHARASQSNAALVTALRTQIHFDGGPCRSDSDTKRLLDETDQLARRAGQPLRATWIHQASVFRAVFGLQRGDRAGVDHALDTLGQCANELQHAELSWHYDRMRVVDRMNRGALRDVEPALRELRHRAKRLRLFAYEAVCGNDSLVLLRQTIDLRSRSSQAASAAQPQSEDAPGVLALKLRAAIDMGLLAGAQAIFNDFAQRGFERLPCERDYLGVLFHLALAAVVLEEHVHARTLLALLEPHGDRFAADVSFHTDGSIAHALGLLTRMFDRRSEALAHFERAVASNDAFGLHARAAESRLELAATLLLGSQGAERSSGLELLLKVQGTARALGLGPLLARVHSLLASHG